MVSIKNITEKGIKEKEKFNKAKSLVEEVFGDFFRVLPNINGKWIIIEEEDELATFFSNNDLLKVYNKKYENIFKKFGKMYEKELKIENLDIELDYSSSIETDYS